MCTVSFRGSATGTKVQITFSCSFFDYVKYSSGCHQLKKVICAQVLLSVIFNFKIRVYLYPEFELQICDLLT
jgi:hypothetical protein